VSARPASAPVPAARVEQIVQVLGGVDLFKELPGSVTAALVGGGRLHQLIRGDRLLHEGDPSDELFVVLDGEIAISTRAPDGRESIVAVLSHGALLGELPLFDAAPRVADARAVSDTEVLAIPYAPVRDALTGFPPALWGVAALLAARLRAADDALADAAFLDVPGRTAKRLLDLAGDADEFSSPLTQEELAGRVGASRERVNRALSTFVRLGWIELVERGRYRILDRRALEQRSAR
jgi:CRP/FNR family transcriptional regulator, cyclic AMP receptor protein